MWPDKAGAGAVQRIQGRISDRIDTNGHVAWWPAALEHRMVHEVTILSGRRQPMGSAVARSHAYPLIGSVLVATFVIMFLFVADGGGGRTGWDVATASVGVVVAMWLAGGWWSGWAPARQQSGNVYHLSQVTPEPPPVIREPESGWWDAQPESTPTAMTVAVVRESDTRWSADAVVSRLAELAVR